VNIHLKNNQVEGEIIKDNETYLLRDNKTLKNLILSQTVLHKGQSTRGHSHAGQEEVYYFVHGKADMQVGETIYTVRAGDIVLIPDGDFHRVINTGETDCIFNCVFDGKRNH